MPNDFLDAESGSGSPMMKILLGPAEKFLLIILAICDCFLFFFL